jgi:hypothetical protein
VQALGGAQNIRVAPGEVALTSRVTACGREGDFNMLFSDNAGFVSVLPAQQTTFVSGERAYLVVNVASSLFIKNMNACPDSVNEFIYIIIRQ